MIRTSLLLSPVLACMAATASLSLKADDAKSSTCDVFLVAGQSNATGLASPTNLQQPALTAPQTPVWFYANSTVWTPGSVPNGTVWATQHRPVWEALHLPTEPATPPRGAPGEVLGTFGPEFGIGRTYVADGTPTVAIIKSSWPGTNIAKDWDPDATSGMMLYHKLIENTHQGMAAFQAASGQNGKIAAFFWMQGEGDTIHFADQYKDNLTKLIARFRHDLDDPALPFIIGRVPAQGSSIITAGRMPIVRQAQEAVVAAVDHTKLVDTDDLPMRTLDPKVDPVPVHYNEAGQMALGERFAWAYGEMQGKPAHVAIPGLINTGMAAAIDSTTENQNSNRLDDGAQDPAWQVQVSMESPASPQVGSFSPDSNWINQQGFDPAATKMTPYANSKWIVPGTTEAGQKIVYSIQFNLSGLKPASAVITGELAGAPETEVYLNGVPVQVKAVHGFQAWSAFTIQANTLPAGAQFQSGANTLSFVVNSCSSDPQGLRVEFIDAKSLKQ